jgi:hypothetical protein
MLTQERLKALVHYNPDTGDFIWKVSLAMKNQIAKIAGCINPLGYNMIQIDTISYLGHRLAFLYMTGSIPEIVDHIDGNPLNNSWDNLRSCTVSQNSSNKRLGSNNTSGIKGIRFRTIDRNERTTHVVASIMLNKKQYSKSIRYFDEPSKILATNTAIEWLQAAREQLHGEFARHE